MKQGAQIQGVPTPLLWTGKANAIRDGIDTVSSAFALRSSAIGTPVTGAALTEPGSTSRFSLASCNVNLEIDRTISEAVGPAAGFSLLSSLVRTPVNSAPLVEDSPGAAAFSLASVLQRSAVNRTVTEDSPGRAAFSLLSCNAGLSPVNTAWLARVVAAGGAAPAQTTYQGNDIFYNALVAGGIDSKVKIALLLCPDSLTTACVPLFKNTGNSLWTPNGFVGGDLTVNGLIGQATGKWLDTGAATSNIFGSDNSGGVSIYATTINNNQCFEIGRFGSAAGQCFQGSINYSDSKTRFDCWDNNATETQVASPGATGFYGLNRVSLTDSKVFFANSGNAPAQVGATNGLTVASTRFNDNLVAMATMTQSGVLLQGTTRRISAIILHDGLTLSEWTVLYNAIQAARTAFGGGFV